MILWGLCVGREGTKARRRKGCVGSMGTPFFANVLDEGARPFFLFLPAEEEEGGEGFECFVIKSYCSDNDR